MNVLKSIRDRSGYSQAELAQVTGLSLRTIQRLEAANTPPKGHTLKVLAKEFNMEPTALKALYQEKKNAHNTEISSLKILNLSILTFLGIPFGNLLFPVLIWLQKKNSKLIDEVGRRIINVQIIFTLGLCLILLLTPFTLSKLFPELPLMLIFFALAYLLNIIIVVKTALKIQAEDFSFLQLSIRLI